MLSPLVVGILVGLVALVAVVLLLPAVLLARFLRDGGPAEAVAVRPVSRQLGARAVYARPR